MDDMYFSAGWNTEPLEGNVFSDYVMTFCNKTNMEGQCQCVSFSVSVIRKDIKIKI